MFAKCISTYGIRTQPCSWRAESVLERLRTWCGPDFQMSIATPGGNCFQQRRTFVNKFSCMAPLDRVGPPQRRLPATGVAVRELRCF